MANILYFSNHEPLEYDDVKLFTGMGHVVFPLGKYCPAENEALTFRKPLGFAPGIEDLVALYKSERCRSAFMNLQKTHLTSRFLNAFDAVVEIQSLDFFSKYWDMIEKPVKIWRTVGQAIDHMDPVAATFRKKGMKIVRWSDREQFMENYAGHDAIIRAYKDPDEFGPWTGRSGRVVTFSNSYKQRYPIEAGMFERVTYLLPASIGGANNDGLPNSIGLLSLDELRRTMTEAGVYFYIHGSVVPYTLNFIEAWMTGVPILAARRDVEIHNIDMKYNEINDLIIHGWNGFLFKSETEAKGILMNLLLDKPYAASIGAQGRKTAIQVFGKERAEADWGLFFRAFLPTQVDARRQRSEQ